MLAILAMLGKAAVEIKPAPSFAHEAAHLVQAMRAPFDLVAGHEFDAGAVRVRWLGGNLILCLAHGLTHLLLHWLTYT